MLLDDVGQSRVRSRARLNVGSHDHGACGYGVTIDFLFALSSDKQVIVKSYLQLDKKPPNPTRERGEKPVLF